MFGILILLQGNVEKNMVQVWWDLCCKFIAENASKNENGHYGWSKWIKCFLRKLGDFTFWPRLSL